MIRPGIFSRWMFYLSCLLGSFRSILCALQHFYTTLCWNYKAFLKLQRNFSNRCSLYSIIVVAPTIDAEESFLAELLPRLLCIERKRFALKHRLLLEASTNETPLFIRYASIQPGWFEPFHTYRSLLLRWKKIHELFWTKNIQRKSGLSWFCVIL